MQWSVRSSIGTHLGVKEKYKRLKSLGNDPNYQGSLNENECIIAQCTLTVGFVDCKSLHASWKARERHPNIKMVVSKVRWYFMSHSMAHGPHHEPWVLHNRHTSLGYLLLSHESTPKMAKGHFAKPHHDLGWDPWVVVPVVAPLVKVASTF